MTLTSEGKANIKFGLGEVLSYILYIFSFGVSIIIMDKDMTQKLYIMKFDLEPKVEG